MQEWVDTLRLKLREMKILSPKENLYSKLPEAKPPLLPTRDPMSPLPATPPIPAALVPGVERVFPNSSLNSSRSVLSTTSSASISQTAISTSEPTTSQHSNEATAAPLDSSTASSAGQSVVTAVPSTSMSNTLTQNLINMLSNPVSAYSSQLDGLASESETSSLVLDEDGDEAVVLRAPREVNVQPETSTGIGEEVKRDSLPSLAQTFANNVLSDPNTCSSASGLSSYVSRSTGKRDSHPDRAAEGDAGESGPESITSSGFQTLDPIVIPR